MTMKALQRVHYDSGPNMTPLVDVVMVILIFLMLTGTFGAATKFLPGAPAVPSPSRGPGTVAITNPAVLTLRVVSREGEFVASSPDLGRDLVGQPIRFRTVDSLLEALKTKRREKVAAGMKQEDLRVVISPEGKAKFEHVMNVYEAVLAARWPKVGFGTEAR